MTNSFWPFSSTAFAMPDASVEPSNRITNGMQKSRETMVTKLYRLRGLILLMSFLLKDSARGRRRRWTPSRC